MAQDLEAIGNELREAYAVSVAKGHEVFGSYMAPDMKSFHVPAGAHDGEQDITPEMAAQEAGALEKLGGRLSVESVRVIGDDTLVMERVLTGTFPDGAAFRFQMASVFTFRDGKCVRSIGFVPKETSEGLAAAFRQVAPELSQ